MISRNSHWNLTLHPSLLFIDGEYVEMEALAAPVLTLIPPAMFGPPEKVWADKTETDKPGLVLAGYEVVLLQ